MHKIYYVIAKDNLNRDYHNDILTAVFLYKTDAMHHCARNNYESAPYFYEVKIDLDSFDTSSFLDVCGKVPSLDKFLEFTGLGLADRQLAIDMYNKQYNLGGSK